MPTSAQVRVNTVRSTVRGDSNMLELTGYDNTNRRGFKKLFFETKKDGGLTKNAETANTLKQDDWVEITMDDTSYKNVQSIKRIQEPAGSDVPSQGGGQSSSGGGGGGQSKTDKMSKAEWAAKDAKKELGVARSVALKAAVAAVSGDGKGFTKVKAEQIQKMIDGFTSYLLNGNFDGKPEPEVVVPETPAEAPADKQPGDDRAAGQATDGGEKAPIDDDIPF
ncbi:MAG: hypothetical protein JRE23_03325 [Deltaproteobacteria bacterium]|nr:hypothetical protein [Deltaproteobacteria bacterium]